MSPPAPWLLGAITVDLPKSNRSVGRLPSLILSDVLLIVGLGLGLLLVLAAGVYLWTRWHRKRRRHVSSGEKVYRGAEDDAPEHGLGDQAEEEDQDDDHSDHHHSRRKYKYRVRRRTHRSRNPTLSETGGLPPVKSHEPSQPR